MQRYTYSVLLSVSFFLTGCLFRTSVKEKDCAPAASNRAAAPAVATPVPTKVPCAAILFDEVVETPEAEAESVETAELAGGLRVRYTRKPVQADRPDEDSVFRAIHQGNVIATAEQLKELVEKVKEICQ